MSWIGGYHQYGVWHLMCFTSQRIETKEGGVI